MSNGVYEYAPDPNCSIPVPKIRKNNHLRVYTATGTEPFLKERQFQNDSFFSGIPVDLLFICNHCIHISTGNEFSAFNNTAYFLINFLIGTCCVPAKFT